MGRHAAAASTVLLLMVCLPGHAWGAARDLFPGVSDEVIAERARGVGRPLWRVPLGPVLIEDMRYLSPDRLLVATRKDFPGLPSQELLLVDTSSGLVLWRLDRSRSKADFKLLAFEKDVLVYQATDRKKGNHTLFAISAGSGAEKWSILFNDPVTSFFPVLPSGKIVAAGREKGRFYLRSMDLESGAAGWRRELPARDDQSPPHLLQHGSDLWIVHAHLTKLSAVDGKAGWSRDDINPSLDGAPPVLDGRDLLLMDGQGNLLSVHTATGETNWSRPLPEGIYPSNISLGGRFVFLRGVRPNGQGGEGGHRLVAFSREDGGDRWSFASAEPVMSNIVQRGDRLYFGTTSSLFGLQATTGKKVFRSQATGAGWLYPVKIRDYPGTVVYISEFTVAGFDPESGKRLFTRGVSPVSSEADLAALDAAIPRLKGEVETLGREKTDFGSSYAFGQMTQYQSQANYYRMRNERGMEAKYRSDADFQRDFFLYFGTAEIIVDLGKILEMKSIRTSIERQMLFRQSILKCYAQGEIGDYVVRPDRKWVSASDDFVGVTAVHLPTGKSGFTYLSPAYMTYGLWNLVDFERQVVIHHGIGLDPSGYEYSEPRKMHPYGSVRTIKTYLIALPITVPR